MKKGAGYFRARKVDVPPLTIRGVCNREGNRPTRGDVDPRPLSPVVVCSTDNFLSSVTPTDDVLLRAIVPSGAINYISYKKA